LTLIISETATDTATVMKKVKEQSIENCLTVIS